MAAVVCGMENRNKREETEMHKVIVWQAKKFLLSTFHHRKIFKSLRGF